MMKLIATLTIAFVWQLILVSIVTSGVKAISKDCGEKYPIDFLVLDSLFCSTKGADK